MYSDGYENHCSELVHNAKGPKGPSHEDLGACEKFKDKSNSTVNPTVLNS